MKFYVGIFYDLFGFVKKGIRYEQVVEKINASMPTDSGMKKLLKSLFLVIRYL